MVHPLYCHGSPHLHSGNHVLGVCFVLARDIEGGPVIYRGANDGDPERYIDCLLEVDQLHGDVTLIVIHRDNQVIGAARRQKKNRVWPVRPVYIDAFLGSDRDGWSDLSNFFLTKKPVLASVRIETAHGDAWMLDSKKFHGFIAELNGAEDLFT